MSGSFTTSGTVTTTSAPRQLSDGNGLTGGPGVVMGSGPADKVGFFSLAGPGVPQPGTAGNMSSVAANITIYGSAQSPTIVAANTSGERAMTITGVLATDAVFVVKPTAQAGLMVGTARVSAASTVQLTFGNVTGSGITPTASEVYAVIAIGAALQTSAVLTPAAVAANTVSEQFFTVAGVQLGQQVFVNKPTVQAGLIIVNARASAANQVAIQFENLTAAPITPTAGETYVFASASGFQPAPVMSVSTVALTPVSVAANTSAEQTFTVAGLISGGKVAVTKPSVTSGLSVAGARISAANTLAITFANNTASAIVPPVESYQVAYFTTQAGNTDATSSILPASKGNDVAAMATLGLTSGT